MRIIYKRSLLFIGLLIIVIASIGVGYLFYDHVIHPETLVVVKDQLSINYLDGSTVIEDGEYRFSVTNNGDSDINYRVFISDINGLEESVNYTLYSSDANVLGEKKYLGEDENIITDVFIKSLDTQNFVLKVSDNASTTFKINVEKIDDLEEYFYMTLLNQNEVKDPLTEVGSEIATSNEGLIASTDDDGITYYFRGKVENNYVLFANLMWRITRINGDGSVRLILNDVADTLVNYHDTLESYESFRDTNIYSSLNAYYESTLKNYDAYIANTRFCSESGKNDDTYNAYERIVTNKIPTLNCLGERFTSKIGLLTVDEVIYAGGLYHSQNTDYYLYHEDIDQLWWTNSLSKIDEQIFYPFLVNASGMIVDDTSGFLYRSMRPVISLNRTTTVQGSGTITDPYTVN